MPNGTKILGGKRGNIKSKHPTKYSLITVITELRGIKNQLKKSRNKSPITAVGSKIWFQNY